MTDKLTVGETIRLIEKSLLNKRLVKPPPSSPVHNQLWKLAAQLSAAVGNRPTHMQEGLSFAYRREQKYMSLWAEHLLLEELNAMGLKYDTDNSVGQEDGRYDIDFFSKSGTLPGVEVKCSISRSDTNPSAVFQVPYTRVEKYRAGEITMRDVFTKSAGVRISQQYAPYYNDPFVVICVRPVGEDFEVWAILDSRDCFERFAPMGMEKWNKTKSAIYRA
jgi:hypothetical protein